MNLGSVGHRSSRPIQIGDLTLDFFNAPSEPDLGDDLHDQERSAERKESNPGTVEQKAPVVIRAIRNTERECGRSDDEYRHGPEQRRPRLLKCQVQALSLQRLKLEVRLFGRLDGRQPRSWRNIYVVDLVERNNDSSTSRIPEEVAAFELSDDLALMDHPILGGDRVGDGNSWHQSHQGEQRNSHTAKRAPFRAATKLSIRSWVAA